MADEREESLRETIVRVIGEARSGESSRFSYTALVVFVLTECTGIPLCIAGGDGAAHSQLLVAAIGWGFGLPLALTGFTFPFWRHRVRIPIENWVRKYTNVLLPVAVLLAFAYVVGPDIYQRATRPIVPSGPFMWSAPTYEGSPLGWVWDSVNLGVGMSPNGDNTRVNSFSISGKNVGPEEVNLQEAHLISGISGETVSMKVNASQSGIPVWIDISDAAPVPPGAEIDLGTQFNGMPEADFLRNWGQFSVIIQYNDQKIRHDYSREFIRSLLDRYHPERAPHVSKKKT